MAPFAVLVALFTLLSILGYFGLPVKFGWWPALRLALAGMFLLTASAHWGRRRADLVRMVPPGITRPELAVTLTGILEIGGAIGLLVPTAARYAALMLCLMLIAVFPANVHAARHGLTIGGRRVPGLLPRSILQALFIAATLGIVVGGRT